MIQIKIIGVAPTETVQAPDGSKLKEDMCAEAIDHFHDALKNGALLICDIGYNRSEYLKEGWSLYNMTINIVPKDSLRDMVLEFDHTEPVGENPPPQAGTPPKS